MILHLTGIFFVVVAASGCCSAQVVVQSVLNAASYSSNVAPGTYAAIFGTNLASTTTIAPGVPLPTQLGGVTVTFGGIAAPINFVSSGQINAVIPFEVPTPANISDVVPVVVNTPAGTSAVFNIHLSRNAPALFTKTASGTGTVLAFDGNFAPVAVAGNSPIVMYATGLGPTNPAGSSAGGGATTPPFNPLSDSLSVFIGDVKATVGFAGLAPGLPGVYQLNVTPNGPVSDRVYMQIGNWQSNVVTLPVQASVTSNVANVRGTIDGLFPATGDNAVNFGAGGRVQRQDFSVMLMGASFTVDFDIAPTAKPFSVVATSEAGSALILIDPAKNTYQASNWSPLAGPRSGDFSKAQYMIRDFLTCLLQVCSPFPANTIPSSRQDPVQLKALQALPFPTSTNPDGINGLITSSGGFQPGHFSISSSSLSNLSSFGGFIQIPYDRAAVHMTTFSLYVDGKQIATKDVAYTLP